jgi:hypothetical protein
MNQFNSLKKSLVYLLTLLFFSNCYLHHANVVGDGYGVKEIVNFSSDPKRQEGLPVRIEFDVRERAFIEEYLKRKGQNISVSSNLIDGYYSEEIITKFRNSNLFYHDTNANVKVRIVSTIEEVKAPIISMLVSIGTLFIAPMITRTYGRVEFELFDSQKRRLIKSYKYPIEHRSYMGLSSAIFGSIFPLYSDRFDHSTNEKNYAIMRVAFNQFESDLNQELSKDSKLSARFFKKENIRYAFLPFAKSNEEDNFIYSRLYSDLEQGLLERGLFLVERSKLDILISEIKFSNSGLTDANRLQFGKFLSVNHLILVTDQIIDRDEKRNSSSISFTIKCIEVQTGAILWSNRFKESFKGNSALEETSNFAYKILSELRMKGDI